MAIEAQYRPGSDMIHFGADFASTNDMTVVMVRDMKETKIIAIGEDCFPNFTRVSWKPVRGDIDQMISDIDRVELTPRTSIERLADLMANKLEAAAENFFYGGVKTE